MRRLLAFTALVLIGARVAATAEPATATETLTQAPATVADRGVTSPGEVTAIARSGFSVAFVSGPTPGHCGPRPELWNLVSRGVTPLGRHTDVVCNEGPSTGSGVSAVSVAGNRVLWLFHAGGNLTDWVLYTATATRPSERQLEFQEVETGERSPILVGDGSDLVLPYAVGRRVKVLSATGKLLYTWPAPADVNALTSYGNQVGVYMSGGRAVVLSPAGAVSQSSDFPLGAVAFRLGGDGLVVQLGGGVIQVRKGARLVRTLTLPAGGRMLDYAEGIVLYALGNQLRAVRLATGRDAGLRTLPAAPVLAQLEPNGLSYASGKNVYSVPMVEVRAAIGF